MSEEFRPPPYIYEGLDPVQPRKTIFAEAAGIVGGFAASVSEVIETGRKPGMPLSVLSNVAREAPLGSLLAAFLLGYIVSQRRR